MTRNPWPLYVCVYDIALPPLWMSRDGSTPQTVIYLYNLLMFNTNTLFLSSVLRHYFRLSPCTNSFRRVFSSTSSTLVSRSVHFPVSYLLERFFSVPFSRLYPFSSLSDVMKTFRAYWSHITSFLPFCFRPRVSHPETLVLFQKFVKDSGTLR